MKKMPLLFVGHGSPMNAIEVNHYTEEWIKIAAGIPAPEAILAISAHWYTDGIRISDASDPKMIYDMYGFPDALYKVEYKAVGSPQFAHETVKLINRNVKTDNSWGIDHGSWSVLCNMYPKADIPVYQLSVAKNAAAQEHFQMGREISALREKGVLIFASGNVVHNLSKVSWDMEGGYPWAEEFDGYIREKIIGREYRDIIDYKKAGKSAELSFLTPDHFYPLLYVLGASDKEDKLKIYNNSCTLGSLSMTSYLFE